MVMWEEGFGSCLSQFLRLQMEDFAQWQDSLAVCELDYSWKFGLLHSPLKRESPKASCLEHITAQF